MIWINGQNALEEVSENCKKNLLERVNLECVGETSTKTTRCCAGKVASMFRSFTFISNFSAISKKETQGLIKHHALVSSSVDDCSTLLLPIQANCCPF